MTQPSVSAGRPALPAAILVLLALLAALPPSAGAELQHEDVDYRWSGLPSDLPLAGHSSLLAAEDRWLLIGGESGFGAPGLARSLELGAVASEWADLEQTGSIPRSRQAGRGLIGARAILDADDDRLLLICDCQDGQTYLYDLASGEWTQVETETDLALWYPGLVYDAERDRAILFGGDRYGTNSLSDEVWALDLSAAPGSWQALPAVPFRLLHQAYAVDPASGDLLVVGGQDETGAAVAAAWRVDLASIDRADAWQPLGLRDGAPAPSARIGATMVFATGQSAFLLYGGYVAGEDGATDLAEIWRLDYDHPESPAWESVEARLPLDGQGPGARAGHAADWDPSQSRMLVYGGTRGEGGDVRYLADAWSLAVGEDLDGAPIYLPIGFNGLADGER